MKKGMGVLIAVCTLYVFLVGAQSSEGELFSPAGAPKQKDWTILFYMNTDQLAPWAIENLGAVASSMRNETTSVVAFCNYLPTRAWIWELTEGCFHQKKSVVFTQPHEFMLPMVMEQVAAAYPARHYSIVVWGHVSGKADQIFDAEKMEWVYPTGTLECTDGFCGLRGILYDNAGATSMRTDELCSAMARIKNTLGKELDLMVTDACGMAHVELAAALAGSVRFMTGTQDCQRVDGLDYARVFNELNKRGVGGRELAELVVNSYGTLHDALAPGGKHTYAGIDCAAAGNVWREFYGLMTIVLQLIAANPTFGPALYKAREGLVSSTLFPDYIDMQSWLQKLDSALQNLQGGEGLKEAASGKVREVLDRCRAAIIANVAGGASKDKKGLSLYYPLTDPIEILYPQTDAWHAYVAQSMEFFLEAEDAEVIG